MLTLNLWADSNDGGDNAVNLYISNGFDPNSGLDDDDIQALDILKLPHMI